MGLFFSPLFKVRERENITEEKDGSGSVDWQNKEHNAKMDELEAEMNRRGKDNDV